MQNFINTASEYSEMQLGFLASYEKCVDIFLNDIKKVGKKTDTPIFACMVLKLKEDTSEAYHYLNAFMEKSRTSLLVLFPEQLQNWSDRFYQQIRIELKGTLKSNIKLLIKKHPELFCFTRREVCQQTTSFLENPENVSPLDMGAMNICMVYQMNKRFYSLLQRCIREQNRTDEDVSRIFQLLRDEYSVHDGAEQINHLKRLCHDESGNERLTKAQNLHIYQTILNEIDEPALRRIIDVNWEKPVSLIKALRAKGYGEEVMENVLCACIKLKELKNIYKQMGAPEPQNYNQKLTDFTTACVQDIQATTYSKDKERLIRNSNEWFFVHRIFLEMGVEGLTQRKQFVQMLKKLPIKVDELPMHPCNLNRIAQEFKDRNYPNWEPLGGRFAAKHERYMELGAATLKAYEKHKNMLS